MQRLFVIALLSAIPALATAAPHDATRPSPGAGTQALTVGDPAAKLELKAEYIIDIDIPAIGVVHLRVKVCQQGTDTCP